MERIDFFEAARGNCDDGEFPGDAGASPDADGIYTTFLRCKREACRAIEMAAEEDSLEGAAWQTLRQRLNQLASTAGYFGAPELGLLARDLEHGLDILSPRGRTRRLRNARTEFFRLAMRFEG